MFNTYIHTHIHRYKYIHTYIHTQKVTYMARNLGVIQGAPTEFSANVQRLDLEEGNAGIYVCIYIYVQTKKLYLEEGNAGTHGCHNK